MDSKKDVKSNSTSSIFLTSTINSPDIKSLIKAVATILQSQLIEDIQLGKNISSRSDLYYFSENKYIDEFPSFFDEPRIKLIRTTPALEDISDFIESLYNCAQFSPECCVISLIYVNRIIALTGLSMHPTNWRPLVLISLMIAQKMWDDKYLSNADFAYIYPFFNADQINTLEMKFLEMIQYNTHIKFSMYSKYYFELKSLFPEEINLKPMDVFTLNKLENQTYYDWKKLSKSDVKDKNSGQSSIFIIN